MVDVLMVAAIVTLSILNNLKSLFHALSLLSLNLHLNMDILVCDTFHRPTPSSTYLKKIFHLNEWIPLCHAIQSQFNDFCEWIKMFTFFGLVMNYYHNRRA